MRVFILIALFAAANAGILRFPIMEGLTEEWDMYKNAHKKVYESPEHETLRWDH